MNKKKKITEARSKKNGIIFYSNTFPFIGIETFYDDSGQIQSRLIPMDLDDFVSFVESSNEKKNLFNKKHFIIFNITLILFSIIGFVYTKNFGLIVAAIYFCALVSRDFLIIVNISYNMKSKNGNEYSTGKFHAAEHMVINAYNNLERIPTLEEAKTFSRFSKKCGSRFLLSRTFILLLLTITMATLSSYNGFIYFTVILAILVFNILAEKYGYLAFLQILFTNKPTDKEIKLAIEGLIQFETMENNLENKDYHSMVMVSPSPFIPPSHFDQWN